MITVLKLNIITEDEGLPGELRERLEPLLHALMRDDPEGADRAVISLEWKQSIFPHTYMQTLVGRTAERITVPPEPAAAANGRNRASLPPLPRLPKRETGLPPTKRKRARA